MHLRGTGASARVRLTHPTNRVKVGSLAKCRDPRKVGGAAGIPHKKQAFLRFCSPKSVGGAEFLGGAADSPAADSPNSSGAPSGKSNCIASGIEGINRGGSIFVGRRPGPCGR